MPLWPKPMQMSSCSLTSSAKVDAVAISVPVEHMCVSTGGHEALQLLKPMLHEDHLRRLESRGRFPAQREQELPSIRGNIVTSSPSDREISAFEYRLWISRHKRRGRLDSNGHQCGLQPEQVGTPSGSDVVLDLTGPGNNKAFGNCSLSVGVCTFSGGTGKFTWFQARVDVSFNPDDGLWYWEGTYSFSPQH
jgi:hypothetical protein